MGKQRIKLYFKEEGFEHFIFISKGYEWYWQDFIIYDGKPQECDNGEKGFRSVNEAYEDACEYLFNIYKIDLQKLLNVYKN